MDFPASGISWGLRGSGLPEFSGCIDGADALRNGLIAWAQRMPLLGWIFPIL